MINKDINLGFLTANYPELAMILMEEYGLHCMDCSVRSFETLEQGLKVHGYSKEEIKDVVEKLNKKAQQ